MSDRPNIAQRMAVQADDLAEKLVERNAEIRRLMVKNEEWRVLSARQLEQFTVDTREYADENRRFRAALERIANDENLGYWEGIDLAREVLAQVGS